MSPNILSSPGPSFLMNPCLDNGFIMCRAGASEPLAALGSGAAMIVIAARRFSRVRRALFAGLALFLAGCVAPPGPLLSGPLPPQPPGTARIVVYRDLDYYATRSMPTVYLNDKAAGISENGGVFYRDVAPGT